MKKIIVTIALIPVLFILVLAINFFLFQRSANEVTSGTPIAQEDTVVEALMVIDIQEGTTGDYSDNEYYQMRSAELIKTVNLLADSSANNHIPVIYIKSVIHDPLINIINDTYAPDSPGSLLDERLRVVSDNIFPKDRADAFSNAALDSFLIGHGINKLVFTGLDLNGCVNYTIEAALNRNYRIAVVSDAVLAKSDSLMISKLEGFREAGLEIISSDEYFKLESSTQ